MSSEHAKEIARRLIEIRDSKGHKERGFASRLSEAAGVTRKAAIKWVNGENAPSSNSIRKIATFLEISPSWLEYGESSGQVREPALEYKTESLGHVDVYESNDPLHPNEVEVPFFSEIELSAGNGYANVLEIASHSMRFDISTLNSAGVNTDKAACCRVNGDSMEPVLPDGAIVAVDTFSREITDGKMYAINHGGLLRVKYLYRLPFRGLRIRSANPNYPDEELSSEAASDIKIIGRVFWFSALI
ncbi:XRE family transcriptional regulator [Marinomonas piezotolerans]|uniref:XRE family transcriptional regulator n=1 Tax=Marinomonas piezotolerans TaxID=2213058 RepID=A0A370U991_9GAMM|nr:helix-turn-helix transcriptional regulator [Marinomonas piezotolerans]RDL44335.1 XRE family transcriptional regulator [Marinomonas piezotolerans]